MAINYFDIDTFKGIDLSDSFILGWKLFPTRLVFELEFSLWPQHPRYMKPKPHEYTCYRKGELIFPDIREISELKSQKDTPSSIDPDGSRDYGNIDSLVFSEPNSWIAIGDFGKVQLKSNIPIVHIL